MSKLIIFIFCCCITSNAYAYLGLGPLIPIFGNILIYLVILLIGFFGILAYPIKIFINRIKKIKKLNKKENNIE